MDPQNHLPGASSSEPVEMAVHVGGEPHHNASSSDDDEPLVTPQEQPSPSAATADESTAAHHLADGTFSAVQPTTTTSATDEVANASFASTASFAELPTHLRGVARQIRNLEPSDLLTIAEMTQRVTSRELYSLLPYAGSNWYLPEIKHVHPGDPQWGIKIKRSRHYTNILTLAVTIAGRKVTLPIGSWALRCAVLVLIWYMLYHVLWNTSLMTRGGYVWDPVVTFVVSSVVGGFICRILQLPPLLGVLWISIMWANIPEPNYLTAGIEKHVSKIAQRVGLTIVLCRAGFSLSVKSVKPHWKESLLLATLPYGVQCVTHALISRSLFDGADDTWSFLEGTLVAVASPAIIVPGVLYLQEEGYGLGHGPLSLMLSSVSLEVCCGVWAANFIIGLIFDSQPLAEAIVLGPVQFIGGIIIGIVLGIAFHYLIELIKTSEGKRLPNGRYSKQHITGVMRLAYCIFVSFSVGFVFFGYNYHLAGGGAVCCVFFSATVAHMWIKDDNKEFVAHKAQFGQYLASTWDILVMPALFSMVGVQCNLKSLFNSTFTPKALVCFGASTAARMIVIFLIQWAAPYDWKQKVLVCFGYIGKATAQAAIGPTALANVKDAIANEGSSPYLLAQKVKAERVLNMALLYLLFSALIAAVFLTKVGPRVLPCSVVKR